MFVCVQNLIFGLKKNIAYKIRFVVEKENLGQTFKICVQNSICGWKKIWGKFSKQLKKICVQISTWCWKKIWGKFFKIT